MERPTPSGETDTEIGGQGLLRLRPVKPTSHTTSAYETENLPEWKRFGLKYRNWITIAIITILIIIIVALAISLASVDRKSSSVSPCRPDAKNENATCMTSACVITAAKILADMNPEVSPCVDFYEFACGGYEKSTMLTNDEGARSLAHVISEQYQQQLNAALHELGGSDEPGAFEIAKNLYQTCLNTTVIEKAGLEPLRKILRQLGRWPLLEEDNWREDSFNWLQSIYRFRKLGYVDGYFISFTVDKESKTRSMNMIVMDQVKLSIPRAHLIEGMQNEIVKAYLAYMIDIAVALGANQQRAIIELTESLKFEIRLANITVSDETRQNITAFDSPIALSEMNNRYPGVDWEEFVNELLPPEVRVNGNESVLVLAPNYFSNLHKIIETTGKRVQANYAMWRVVGSSVRYFTDNVTKRYAEFQAKIDDDYKSKPRWQECIGTVIEKMPISVGALYTRKYLKNKALKETAGVITADIRKAFNKTLEKADWMDNETKTRAQKKTAVMTSHIAYPDEYFDDQIIDEYYKKLEVNAVDLIGYILTLTIFETKKSLGQLREPVEKVDWTSPPFSTEPNVFYDFIRNDLQVPAGILQGGYLNAELPQSMKYGALGYMIGYELTHGFDNQKMGNLVDWWTLETKKNYLEKARCIVDQYNIYRDESLNVNLNGTKTQEANIADNGAIKEAYLAYTEWFKRHGNDTRLPGLDYTPAQLFWVSAANIRCTKYKPDALKHEMMTGVRSPGKYRVIGPFSNMPDFASDFNCPMGSPMHPNHKCSVW